MGSGGRVQPVVKGKVKHMSELGMCWRGSALWGGGRGEGGR